MDPDFPNNNNQLQNPQQPQQTFQPDQSQTPLPQNNQPQTPQPAGQNPYGGDDFTPPSSDNRTKKLLIVIAALIGLFVIIVIIVLAFTGGGKTPADQTQESVNGEFYVKEPSAVDVESVNNSISDNISGLDTNTDFPEDNLSDQKLGL